MQVQLENTMLGYANWRVKLYDREFRDISTITVKRYWIDSTEK